MAKFGQKVALEKCGPFRQEGKFEVCNACGVRWQLRPGDIPRDSHTWYEVTKEETRGITMAGAKFIFRICVEHFNKTGQFLEKPAAEIADEHDLWLVDEWTHLGYAIVTCLNNPKLVTSFLKGNTKVLDTLLGMTIRSANMTVDPEYIKEMIPAVIDRWFKTP